jgi:hypothetical protein
METNTMEVNPSHNFASALFPEKNSCWKFRTRFEKLLVLVIILVIVLCATLIVLMALVVNDALKSKGNDDCDSNNNIGFYHDNTLLDSNATKVCLRPGCVKAGMSQFSYYLGFVQVMRKINQLFFSSHT